MEIREIKEPDLDEIIRIEEDTFTEPWTREGFLSAMAMPRNRYLAAVDDQGRILGYCGYYRSFEVAEITNVAVAGTDRRRGVGYRMLEKLIAMGTEDGVEAFTLEVRCSNEEAIRLYHRLGFITEGIRPRFYSLPEEDAAIMWLRCASLAEQHDQD